MVEPYTYMGSETTAITCMRLNRNFIGFENDVEFGYFELINKRISEEQETLKD